VDPYRDNVSQTITTGREPGAAVSRRDSSVLYIANSGDGSITTFDVQNRLVVASTHTGAQPRALALTPDERFLVAVDSAASSLAVLRTDRPALVTTIPVGTRPVDVVVPDWLK
jgi:YVTN family beta-propeller protein